MKVTDIKVFTEHFSDGSIQVSFYKYYELVATEIYFNTTDSKAITDLFTKVLDTYTEEYLYLNCCDGLTKFTDHTYKWGENDYFYRIENTKYFKHICLSIEEKELVNKLGKSLDKLVDNFDIANREELIEWLHDDKENFINELNWRIAGGTMKNELLPNGYREACKEILKAIEK